MTRTRLLLATTITTVALLAGAAPAGAGGLLVTLEADYTCNTATGEYDIVYTLVNNSGSTIDITVVDFDVDGVPTLPLPSFSPNPVGPMGNSTATVSVPGDTADLFLDIDMLVDDEFDAQASSEITLEGPCVPVTTTTTTTTSTTSTSAPATTSTTSTTAPPAPPAAQPQALAADFTG